MTAVPSPVLPRVQWLLELPVSDRELHALTICPAEPGSASQERLRLPASWSATRTVG